VAPGLLERLLSDILRGTRVADNGAHDTIYQPLEAAHECDRKVGIARAEARE
jgi:hypothetical protein